MNRLHERRQVRELFAVLSSRTGFQELAGVIEVLHLGY
jgi:hypothetical protein